MVAYVKFMRVKLLPPSVTMSIYHSTLPVDCE